MDTALGRVSVLVGIIRVGRDEVAQALAGASQTASPVNIRSVDAVTFEQATEAPPLKRFARPALQCFQRLEANCAVGLFSGEVCVHGQAAVEGAKSFRGGL